MEVKCKECGCNYKKREVYEYKVDNWNLGHYGCTSGRTIRKFKGYEDTKCPHCEEIERLAKEIERLTCPVCALKVEKGNMIYRVNHNKQVRMVHDKCILSFLESRKAIFK